MAVNNNLYPPIVDTYMPAFLIDDRKCKVYFSLSSYNTIEDIKNAQVTIVNQKTNQTAFNLEKYPSAIKITSILKDISKSSDDNYYIEINAEDLKDKDFLINQYYKVQIRFTGIAASMPPQDNRIEAWLSENLQYFSEWSTICLIRGISTPILSIQNFNTLGTLVEWNMSNAQLLGNIQFVDEEETDTLKNYRIKLYDKNNILLADSGILYSNSYNPNEFNYTFKYFFTNGEQYYFTCEYTTRNMYEEKNTFNFIAKQDTSLPFSVSTFEIDGNEENGVIIITAKSSTAFNDTFAILRSSSETNFTIWEDVHTVHIDNNFLNYTWYDKTIESGILYKYGIQRRHPENNTQSILIKKSNPVGLIFDHAFLTRDDKQLKIKFNPSISSMKRMYSDTKIDTIGGQYPFIKRNGAMNYRTFPISGLISFLTDEDEVFTSRAEVYGEENINYYNNFNKENDIGEYNDYIYEREFRKKVSQFLNADDVKLFRSTTEGNILVRLTDVNFTPNINLGRYIWTFSCTANEIDECSIENFDKYEIQKIGDNTNES